MKRWIYFLLLIFLFTNCSANSYVEQNYTKSVYQIKMRDGIKLYTIVYSPKNNSTKYPILLNRTPYGIRPYEKSEFPELIGPSEIMMKEKFIFVYQDVRGKFMSEGEFENMRPQIDDSQIPTKIDESTDTYDTIDWLVKNLPNNNGKVGMWGISYPGFYAGVGAISKHPALKAVSPQAPISNWFSCDDFHHNGAFSLSMGFSFFSGFGRIRDEVTTKWPGRLVTPDKNQFDFYLNEIEVLKNANTRFFKNQIPFWDSMMVHTKYDDFWKSRSILDDYQNIQTAVLVVGGWFDSEDLFGTLKTYSAIEKQNTGIDNFLVMGPWVHGGWARTDGTFLGEVNFDSETSKYYQEKIEYPFFMYYLKDGKNHNLSEISVFNTGKNEWKQFDSWPPKQITKKYLSLNSDKSILINNQKQSGMLKYISNPKNPVPYSSKVYNMSSFYPKEYMVENQIFLKNRKDILSFETEKLQNGITFTGEILANLVASISTSDADFVVKLIDVYPKSELGKDFEQLVRYEIIRGKFRNGLENPEPFVPNQKTEISLVLQDILHTFKIGHKIKVQIQSTFFPFFDRNPQQFIDIPNANNSDFVPSEITIYTGENGSKIYFNELLDK